MKNLLNQIQMQSADQFTITNKQISAIDLMEHAAMAFVNAFADEVPEKNTSIAILCGKGNNGGDGLAIARLLNESSYAHVSVYLIDYTAKETEEFNINLKRLKEIWFPLTKLTAGDVLPDFKEEIIIDAVLGAGLNAVLEGPYRQLALHVNALNRRVIAVDIPTGFPVEGELQIDGVYLKAELVISFQRPKINFFLPESVQALKRFIVVDIGLDEVFIRNFNSTYWLIEAEDIKGLIKPRESFSHKGIFGSALIIAGQVKTMGAALLAAEGCLHAGAGLTTLSIPLTGLTALNTRIPEVMYLDRADLFPEHLNKFNAIAIGPGLGNNVESVNILQQILSLQKPLVIDADALNILAEHPSLFSQLSPGSILSPHMKEFDRMFGIHDSWWKRLATATQKAIELRCVIVLKNFYTFIVSPSGEIQINPTGNPGMAQGGMGDVLTGIMVAFMAQGYTAEKAAQLACYIHGKSGDELAENQVSITASALGAHISTALKALIT